MNRTAMRVLVITVFMSVFLLLAGGAASAVTVTTIPLVGNPGQLRISGHRVCYMNHVDPMNPDSYRVHSFNFSTGIDTEITPVLNDYQDPDVDGDIVVWAESGGLGIYMYDFNAPVVGGTAFPGSGTYSFNPSLSGSILAWRAMDFANTISNIWYRQGPVSTQVTNLPSNQFAVSPDVSGNYIVWYWFDVSSSAPLKVYFYDIAAPAVPGGTIFGSTSASQSDAHVSGSTVVYMDNTDGTDWELYLYTLPDGPPRKITDNLVDEVSPDISGNYVVWAANNQIFLYDIMAGTSEQISDSGVGGLNENPKIDGNHVVWQNQSGTGTSTTYLATIQDETPPAPPAQTLLWTGP
jgi:hypothetical protein